MWPLQLACVKHQWTHIWFQTTACPIDVQYIACLFLLLHSTMSANFSSTERFRVTMISSDGASERVTVQLSLDGLKILTQDGSRTMRSYNLRNVSSWDLMDTSTVIWTKSDVDLEERALTLSGDSTTIRNVVDTLASCCMQ